MKKVHERFIEYTKFETPSDENSSSYPSTDSQLVFGAALVAELKEIGLADAMQNEHGYVFATIPSNIEGWTGLTLGLCAHMDTVRDPSSIGVKARIVEYNGGDILLNEERSIYLRPSEFPSLNKMNGKRLIVTDGTTILGGDDKAGIAEIVTLAEILVGEGAPPHGDIRICFTPDEEIGTGTLYLKAEDFACDIAYTCDGGPFGGFQYETFNAASAKIEVYGLSTHPGTAKDTMKNASVIAMEFAAMLPEKERPEHTEGYEGFYHLMEMSGSCEYATLKYILRDHDYILLQKQIDTVKTCAAEINKKHGEGTVVATVEESYRNMREVVEKYPHMIEAAKAAITKAGATPIIKPVRGGTDGSRISFMGIPCPNLGDGSYNAHSRMEYACIEEMESCVDVLLNIAEFYANYKA